MQNIGGNHASNEFFKSLVKKDHMKKKGKKKSFNITIMNTHKKKNNNMK